MRRYTYYKDNKWLTFSYYTSESYINKFVIDKFFSFDKETFNSLYCMYSFRYGENAGRYLINTYNKWKNAETSMSHQTYSRILCCVPKLLNTEDRFYILSLSIPTIAMRIASKQNFQLNQNNITDYFDLIINVLNSFKYDLNWFFDNIFSKEEIIELKKIVNYILIDGLNNSYNGLLEDVDYLVNELINVNAAVDISIEIPLLNESFKIENPFNLNSKSKKWDNLIPQLNGNMKDVFQRYLLDYSILSQKQILAANISQELTFVDLKNLRSHINSISCKDNIDTNCEFQGKGCNIHIYIFKLNKWSHFTRIIMYIMLIFLCITCGFLDVIYFSTYESLSKWVALFLTVLVISFIVMVKDEIQKGNEYERKRKKFAKN